MQCLKFTHPLTHSLTGNREILSWLVFLRAVFIIDNTYCSYNLRQNIWHKWLNSPSPTITVDFDQFWAITGLLAVFFLVALTLTTFNPTLIAGGGRKWEKFYDFCPIYGLLWFVPIYFVRDCSPNVYTKKSLSIFQVHISFAKVFNV